MNRTVRNTASVLATTTLTALAVYAAVRFGGAAVSPELASASVRTCPATGCTATSCHAEGATGGASADHAGTGQADTQTCPRTGCSAASCHATEGGGYGRGGGSRWGGM